MKKAVTMYMILMSLLLSGCILNDFMDGEKDTDNNDNSVVGGFLPSPIAGMSRTWHSDILNHATGITDTSSYTETITGPVTEGEHDYYTLTATNEMTARKFCVEDNGIYFLIQSSMFPVIGTNPLTPFDTNALFFDFSGRHTTAYDIVDWGTEIEDFFINYYYKGMFIGYETIVTAKGNEYACATFELTYETIYTPKVGGDAPHYKRVERHWFAPDLGRIKKTINTYQKSVLVTSEVDTMIE